MRRTLLSLVMMLAVVASSAGATFAYFADQANSTGNSFTTGTVDITVNNTFNVSNMYPGSGVTTDAKTINNAGSLPFDYKITPALAGGSADLYNALHLEVWNQGFSVKYYDGLLKDFSLGPRALAASASEVLQFQADLPESGGNQSGLQDKNATVTFTFEARSPGGFGPF